MSSSSPSNSESVSRDKGGGAFGQSLKVEYKAGEREVEDIHFENEVPNKLVPLCSTGITLPGFVDERRDIAYCISVCSADRWEVGVGRGGAAPVFVVGGGGGKDSRKQNSKQSAVNMERA